MKKRSEWPSTIKYKENHPAVSFRLPLEDKERLDTILKATGKPISRFMIDFLHNELDPKRELSELGEQMESINAWIESTDVGEHFSVPCPVCKKPMTFSASQSDWKSMVYPKLNEIFGRWHHTKCKPK